MVNPIIPAPIITTSKLSQQDADIGCDPDIETDSGRFLNLVVLVDTNLEPKNKLLLLLNSLFEYETTPFSREMGFGFGQQNDEAEAIFLTLF
jgi:7,8-dihydro-6-hydroxymethylpterin-pyrophosphokinase